MNVYDFIKEQEVKYQKPIDLEDGWSWSMKEHLRRSFLYKHSQFELENENRDLRPNKNIVKPILNIQYRTEGFDVKDIELFVDNPDTYYKSLLVRKLHYKWALEQQIDTAIDDSVVSYVDYGGVLLRKTDTARPETIELRSLAFCDQKNILANPFCIKHKFSPSQLKENTEWGKPENGATITLDELIILTKDEDKIEVYELHGTLPSDWVNEKGEYTPQIQVVAYYKRENGDEQGVTLFSSPEPKLPFKFLPRDKVEDRALGWGGVEELFEPQVWTNWSETKLTEMLEQASKIFYKTTDRTFKSRNNLMDADNGEVFTLQDGKDISQFDNYPRNQAVFNDALERWDNHAKTIGSASEGMLGESPSSGTPFKLFEAQNIEAKGMHRYRQGQLATFWDEVYRDWVLPHLAKEMVKEQTFLAELSLEEMQDVVSSLVVKEANNLIKQNILDGKIPNEQEIETLKTTRTELLSKSNKKFIQILKDDLKGEKLGINTNIVGKQKNLALLTDKVVGVLRQFIATPEIRNDPEMVKLLNVILESSGMSPMLFNAKPLPAPQQSSGNTEPLRELGKTINEPVK